MSITKFDIVFMFKQNKILRFNAITYFFEMYVNIVKPIQN